MERRSIHQICEEEAREWEAAKKPIYLNLPQAPKWLRAEKGSE